MTMRVRLVVLTVAMGLIAYVPVWAQRAAPPAPSAPRTAAPAPAAPPTTTQTPPTPAYSYNPEGRRDPFVSLVARGADGAGARSGKRAEGLAGLMVGEIALKGILQSGTGLLAIVQAPDGKSYVVRPNDRFQDGVVKSITTDALVLLQEVNDPLSLTKQREVRKSLRLLEESK
jgi:type IV pilus assembly protein PilP